MRPRFIPIPGAFLASISSGCERIPQLYYRGFFALRFYFWRRLRKIFRHIVRSGAPRNRCLDFGGGSGVLLPTLSGLFQHVTLVDLVTSEARAVVDEFALPNVTLLEQDAGQADLRDFDVVIAADVLEHFPDVDRPIRVLARAVSTEGVLVTSLPTESGPYVALRRLFGIEKPADHYHTAAEVEQRLTAGGFRRVRTTRLPSRLMPLFLITTWRPSAARGTAPRRRGIARKESGSGARRKAIPREAARAHGADPRAGS